ncbi:MAG: hypothetical protein R6X32_05975 [Chloroflexota bacterium]
MKRMTDDYVHIRHRMTLKPSHDYMRLLEALAEFCRHNPTVSEHLDWFLRAYADEDWASASAKQKEGLNEHL